MGVGSREKKREEESVWFIGRYELYGREVENDNVKSMIRKIYEGKNGRINIFCFVKNRFKIFFYKRI